MGAILTDRFRVVLAENFRRRVALGEDPQFVDSNGNRTVDPIELYLFFAKADSWPQTGVPSPVDNQEAAFDLYDQMIGLKKIPSSEIRSVIPNRTWKKNKVYDIYRHNYGSVESSTNNVDNYVEGNNTETHLYETEYFVVTSEYKVYKCLNNNNNSESTVEPTSTVSAPFSQSDGYTWKYMFSVNANDFEKFKSDEYIPIPEISGIDVNNSILPAPNGGGAIYNVVIKSPGTNYTANSEFDIVGDGQNGKVRITSTDNQGAITGIKVLNPGTGYTFGTINATGGSNAVLEPIITSKEGMATTGMSLELGAYRLALHCKIENSDFVFGNDFSVVGVIYNPTTTTTSSTLIGTRKMTLQYNTSGISPLVNTKEDYEDKLISTPGVGSGASGRIVHYEPDTANNIYTIYFTQENIFNAGQNNLGERASFQDGETINIATGETVTVDTVSAPEIVRGSGEIIYIDNRNTISRAQDQTEDFKIILEF